MESFAHYEPGRSIPREPFVPPLGPTEIANIGQVVFMPHAPVAADVLFIFGTVQADWDGLAGDIIAGNYGKVVLAGQTGPNWLENGEPIAVAMREKLVKRGVTAQLIEVQTESTNTREDVLMSLDLLGSPGSLTYAAKSHHSGRCLRTLRKFFPEIPLHAHLYDASYGDLRLGPDKWWITDLGRSRVYGEYLRIKQYVERGDIAAFP